MKEKCYICGIEVSNKGVFLCEEHALELQKCLVNGENLILKPEFPEHCMICGNWECRIIVNSLGWNYICDECVEYAIKKYDLK